MFHARLAGDHLMAKWLFTWLSLVMSLVVSCFVLPFFTNEMSWMRSWTELSQVLRIFPTSLPDFHSYIIYVQILKYVDILLTLLLIKDYTLYGKPERKRRIR